MESLINEGIEWFHDKKRSHETTYEDYEWLCLYIESAIENNYYSSLLLSVTTLKYDREVWDKQPLYSDLIDLYWKAVKIINQNEKVSKVKIVSIFDSLINKKDSSIETKLLFNEYVDDIIRLNHQNTIKYTLEVMDTNPYFDYNIPICKILQSIYSKLSKLTKE